jgi:hypothetical protein
MQTYANHGRGKMMFKGRLAFDTKYYYPKEDLFIVSSQGNDDIKATYKQLHPKECGALNDTTTVLSCFKFSPLHEDTNDSAKVTGTRVIVISCTDLRGMPKWVLNNFVPKAFDEFIDDFTKEAKKVAL